MERLSRPVAIGVLCAAPLALVAAWFAIAFFDPTLSGSAGVVSRSLGLGPWRGVWFGVGALLAAAVLAPRLAREDLASFSGLFAFIGLAHLLAASGVAVEIVIRDPGSLDPSIVVAWPLGFLASLGPSLIVWLPGAAIWVAAVRRLTIADLPASTDLERFESEKLRNEAARKHVQVDATTLADQGSRNYRNRG